MTESIQQPSTPRRKMSNALSCSSGSAHVSVCMLCCPEKTAMNANARCCACCGSQALNVWCPPRAHCAKNRGDDHTKIKRAVGSYCTRFASRSCTTRLLCMHACIPPATTCSTSALMRASERARGAHPMAHGVAHQWTRLADVAKYEPSHAILCMSTSNYWRCLRTLCAAWRMLMPVQSAQVVHVLRKAMHASSMRL